MEILLHKRTDTQHTLEIRRPRGATETIACDTRSFLLHDLLHYAVETEAGLEGGFWGLLASGKTLADMADRSGAALAEAHPGLMEIERVVGWLTGVAKGVPADALLAQLAHNDGVPGFSLPAWVDAPYITAVQARMRALLGQWRATPFGGTMRLSYPVGSGA